MSFLIGVRNLILRVLYRIVRPLIFLMEPEQAHSALKKIGIALGSNGLTRALTSFFFNYENQALNTKVDGVTYRNPVEHVRWFRQRW